MENPVSKTQFVIRCPSCGKYATARRGLFGVIGRTNKINCECGNVIELKADKMASCICPNCKNEVIFDQSKGDKAKCPICQEPLVTPDSMSEYTHISCPSCGCTANVHKGAAQITCALCGHDIDVQQAIAAAKAQSSDMPSIIELKMTNDVLIKRHPIANFVLGSKLIVGQSQEAVFFKDGVPLDSFGPGGHILTTEKLPKMSQLAPMPFANGDPFNSEVIFVNLIEQVVKWGTPNKIKVREPRYNFYVDLGANGSFKVKIANARKFLERNVGSIDEFRSEDENGDAIYPTDSVMNRFRDNVINDFSEVFLNAVQSQDFDIFLLENQKKKLAALVREEVNKTLEDAFGITVTDFIINHIALPEDDPNFIKFKSQFDAQALNAGEADVAASERQKQITRAGTELDIETMRERRRAENELYKEQQAAAAELVHGEAKSKVMQAQGFTYQQETARNVGMEAMKNGLMGGGDDNDSSVVNNLGEIAGLGLTLGAMGGVMSMARNTVSPVMSNVEASLNPGWTCSCGTAGIVSGFCPNCGAAKPVPAAGWECPKCGAKGITSKFCPDCGAAKPAPAEAWECPKCGAKGITSKFCPDCGAPKPAPAEAWECPKCGAKGITSMFCPDCGAAKPVPETWDCSCGKTGITSKCCPDCGTKKPETALNT